MAFGPAEIEQIGQAFHLGECKIVVYRDMHRRPPHLRRKPGTMPYYLVSGPSCIGGILPIVYLLPSRPPDFEDRDRYRRLPRDVLRTIGVPIPKAAFCGGRLTFGPLRIWRVRVPGPYDRMWKRAPKSRAKPWRRAAARRPSSRGRR